MLVMTRRNGEKIFIGDNVTITIVRTGNSSVRVGIDAPPDVRIVRAETQSADELQALAGV